MDHPRRPPARGVGVYTQCPDCATVFRVTAEALRIAQGNVRCGVCSTSFNALENLSEEPFRATPEGQEPPSHEDTITVEETPGNESIELSTAAEPVPTPESTEVEAAGSDSANEQSFEFDGSAEDLDRLFVQMSATELQDMAATARLGDQPSTLTIDPGVIAASLSVSEDDDAKLLPHAEARPHKELEPTDEFPILVLDESDEEFVVPEFLPSPAPTSAAARAQPLPEPREFQPNPFETPRILIPEELRKGLADEAAAINAPVFDEPEMEGTSRRWPWAVGVGVLMLTLAAQVVDARRDELLRKPAIGPLLAGVYSLFGMSVSSPTDLSAYELRQWGAASDALQPGRLMLRASIVNRASYAQPFPLLRLALQDRYGTTVGVRDIEPVDYLPGVNAATLIEPGQRADAEIRIVDPGKDAVGFEMDVCLPVTGGVRCANEATPGKP